MTYTPERQEDWSYHDYVRAWQKIDSQSAWLKGDLAAAVDTRYGEQTLQRYADDVGVKYDTLSEYRRVALAFPQMSRRLGISWSVHQALAAQTNRFELIASRDDWTLAAAREYVSPRQQPKAQLQAPPSVQPQPSAPAPQQSALQTCWQGHQYLWTPPSGQCPYCTMTPDQRIASLAESRPVPQTQFQSPQPAAPGPNLAPQQPVTPNPAPPMLTLYTADGTPVPYRQPQGRAVFNETKGEGISWAAWSWNPVTGCRHGCDYCYARAITHRWPEAYPAGFEALFHPERLPAPANTAIPAAHQDDPSYRRVFVCSMADLYGQWVPADWIDQVHEAMLASPQWEYILLTKFPSRYLKVKIPAGAWVGTSVDEQKRVRIAENAFRDLEVPRERKWLSLEPLREPLEFSDLSMFGGVVIGAQTETQQPTGTVPALAPPFDWVVRIYQQARESGCQVHLKPNLVNGKPGMQLPDETFMS